MRVSFLDSGQFFEPFSLLTRLILVLWWAYQPLCNPLKITIKHTFPYVQIKTYHVKGTGNRCRGLYLNS